MSHVDDGELTAYADGAYPIDDPVALRISAHLSACGNCRARLEQDQDLRNRAAEILSYAAPVVREAPAFETLQHQVATPLPPRRRTIPLAWAATIILALGLGWFGRGLQDDPAVRGVAMNEERAEPALDAGATAPVAQTPAEMVAPSPATSRQSSAARRGADVPLRETDMQSSGRVSGNVAVGNAAAADAAGAAREAPPVAVPSAPPAPAPQASLAAQLPTAVTVEEQALKSTESEVLSAAQAERRGLKLPRIPELPIARVLLSAQNTTVEQRLSDGKIVSLVVTPLVVTPMVVRGESRKLGQAEAAAPAAARVAVPNMVTLPDGRRVFVSGDLPADSLRALSQKIR
jgi:hypothetical protein